LNEFIKKRRTIRLFIHLRDARHPRELIDEAVKEYIKGFIEPDQCYIEVFTKSDKLKQKDIAKIRTKRPNAILVSNLKKRGIESLEELIFDIVIRGRSCL